MPKGRVSNHRRTTRTRVAKNITIPTEGWPARAYRQGLKVLHFAGVAVAGGKTDKTCVAFLEYYPEQNKIFLSRLFEKIKVEGEVSADQQLHQLLVQHGNQLEMVGVDAPLVLPKCLRCKLKCPGYEVCREPEILWMWEHYRNLNSQRKPKKLFTPYTERCVEMFLTNQLEETFHLQHALGSNTAPLAARMHYVARRLKVPLIETFPKLSIWRLGRLLGVGKSHLLFHKHAVSGDESRKIFLTKLIEKQYAFIYEQDLKAMVENNQAFESFMSAMTAVLEFRGDCEKRPKGFPKGESWISFPKVDVRL